MHWLQSLANVWHFTSVVFSAALWLNRPMALENDSRGKLVAIVLVDCTGHDVPSPRA